METACSRAFRNSSLNHVPSSWAYWLLCVLQHEGAIVMLIFTRYKFKYIFFFHWRGLSLLETSLYKASDTVSVLLTQQKQINQMYTIPQQQKVILSVPHPFYLPLTKITFRNNLVSFFNTRFWENRKCHFLMLFVFLEEQSSLEICCFSFVCESK